MYCPVCKKKLIFKEYIINGGRLWRCESCNADVEISYKQITTI